LFERPESPFTYTNRFLQIEHIAVYPNAQRRGVGAALMNQADKLARELGVSKIQLDSWDFNTKLTLSLMGSGLKNSIIAFGETCRKQKVP